MLDSGANFDTRRVFFASRVSALRSFFIENVCGSLCSSKHADTKQRVYCGLVVDMFGD